MTSRTSMESIKSTKSTKSVPNITSTASAKGTVTGPVITDESLGERVRELKTSNDYKLLVDFLITAIVSGTMLPKLQAKAYNELGLAHLQLDSITEAEKAFLSAMDCDASNMNASFNKANLALYTQQYQEGLAQYLIILDKEPSHAGSQHHAGLCHAMLGSPDKALPFFEKAASLDVDAMGPHYWAGETLLHASEFEKAFYYFNRAVEIMPEHAESRRGLAICLYKQEKYTESLALCDSLIEKGDDFLALRLKGDVLLALNETIQAAQCHISMVLLDFDAQEYLIVRAKDLEKHKPEQAQEYANVIQDYFPEMGNILDSNNKTPL